MVLKNVWLNLMKIVCLINFSSRFVESRAVATLPSNYLYIKQVVWGNSTPPTRSVLAKKLIPKSCQFGPLEGKLIRSDPGLAVPARTPDGRLSFTVQTVAGNITIDCSDEGKHLNFASGHCYQILTFFTPWWNK